jgi:CBS domain-containing protein
MTTTTGTIGTILHHKGATVWTISPQATVFEAIQFLAQKNIGALPVVENDKLVGIFSERDYTRKVALEGKTSHATLVRDILSTHVASIGDMVNWIISAQNAAIDQMEAYLSGR